MQQHLLRLVIRRPTRVVGLAARDRAELVWWGKALVRAEPLDRRVHRPYQGSRAVDTLPHPLLPFVQELPVQLFLAATAAAERQEEELVYKERAGWQERAEVG